MHSKIVSLQIAAEREDHMNKVVLTGRLTRDAEVRYSQGNNQMAIARFTLAVDRRVKRDSGQNADFINCVAFNKAGEFFEKCGRKGIKFAVEGRIQTDTYTNKDGQRVYTTSVVVESAEFAESKSHNANVGGKGQEVPELLPASDGGFRNIPDGIDEELPFN